MREGIDSVDGLYAIVLEGKQVAGEEEWMRCSKSSRIDQGIDSVSPYNNVIIPCDAIKDVCR